MSRLGTRNSSRQQAREAATTTAVRAHLGESDWVAKQRCSQRSVNVPWRDSGDADAERRPLAGQVANQLGGLWRLEVQRRNRCVSTKEGD